MARGRPAVELFPGRLGGPAYVRDLLSPLAGIRLMVTGGVDGRMPWRSSPRERRRRGGLEPGAGRVRVVRVDA